MRRIHVFSNVFILRMFPIGSLLCSKNYIRYLTRLISVIVNRVARHARAKAQIDQHGHVSRPGQARYTRRGTQTLGHQGLCYHSMGGQVNEHRIHQIVAPCGTSHSQPTTKSPSPSRTRSPHLLPPQIEVSYCTGDFCFRCGPPCVASIVGGKRDSK